MKSVPTILTDAKGHAELIACIYVVSNSKGFVFIPSNLTVILSMIGLSITLGHSLEHMAVNLTVFSALMPHSSCNVMVTSKSIYELCLGFENKNLGIAHAYSSTHEESRLAVIPSALGFLTVNL